MKEDDTQNIKKSKLKKSTSSGSSFIKKLKLKGSQNQKSGVSTPSISSSVESEEKASSLPEEDTIDNVRRQSPDGTASDTNLTDNWKSAENLTLDSEEATNTEDAKLSRSQVNVEIVQVQNYTEEKQEDKKKINKNKSVEVEKIKKEVLKERIRSLEDIQAMPAFGELIVDTRVSNNLSASKPTKDHLYKILVIGDLGAGKTSIIKRYVHDFFSQHYRATIGVDFALKVLHWDANTVIRLQLWDIAGQERYGNMTRVYYKEAVGAFIVFDVTRSNTFESVSNWKADLDSKVQLPDGSSIPCVLLGNKCDQQKEGIVNNPNKMNEFCKEKGFSAWFETSAKENVNVEEATRSLINEILTNDVINANHNQRDREQFTLTNNKKDDEKNQKCYKC
ncbi:ras-related protein Rab-32 isoform X1 [Atheta coriaria]|uniref:ras-related protein Rab-32 isoform X1 n=1 Tax=Dalotia coriaria TaxID=877792 RepID=UPI0031F35301